MTTVEVNNTPIQLCTTDDYSIQLSECQLLDTKKEIFNCLQQVRKDHAVDQVHGMEVCGGIFFGILFIALLIAYFRSFK